MPWILVGKIKGTDGSPGSPGMAGGTGIRGSLFLGTYATTGALPAVNGTTVLNNDFAYVSGTGELWQAGASWSLIGKIKGNDGINGTNGLNGAVGASGVVTATSPIAYNSGTQTVSIQMATDAQSGSMSASDHALLSATDAAAGTASRRTLGTGSTQAAAGDHTHSAATNSVAGFLSATDHTAFSTVDAVAGTGSARTLGTGALQAAAGNHTHPNATGSTAGFESAADKTNLDALVAAQRAIRTASAAIPAIASLANGTVTVTWGSAFADTNYQIGFVVFASGLALNISTNCSAKTTTGATFKITNLALAGLLIGTATLSVLAIHD